MTLEQSGLGYDQMIPSRHARKGDRATKAPSRLFSSSSEQIPATRLEGLN